MRTNARIRNEKKKNGTDKKNVETEPIERASDAERTHQTLKGKARCLQTHTHTHTNINILKRRRIREKNCTSNQRVDTLDTHHVVYLKTVNSTLRSNKVE